MQEVLDAIIGATWKTPHGEGYAEQIANAVDMVVLYDLMQLAANDHATDEVRAIARLELDDLKRWVYGPLPTIKDHAHSDYAFWQIEQFQKDPKKIELTAPADPPDGPPIGTDDDWAGWD